MMRCQLPMLGGGFRLAVTSSNGPDEGFAARPALGASGGHPGIDWAKTCARSATVMMVRSPDSRHPCGDGLCACDWVGRSECCWTVAPRHHDSSYHDNRCSRRCVTSAAFPLPRQRARRGVARGGVHLGDAARRPVAADLAVDAVEPASPDLGLRGPDRFWPTSSPPRQQMPGHVTHARRCRLAHRRDAAVGGPRRRGVCRRAVPTG